MSNDSNLLVIVIDTNPFEWEHPSAPLKLNEALQHMLAFMNAHLAGRHDNKLAVIASHVGVSKFLYPTLNELTPGSKVQTKTDANVYQVFKVVNDAVLSGIARLLQDPGPTLEEKDLGSSKIAASLSLGLCYINQTVKSDGMGHVKPRILVLTVSPDSSSDYIPIMNCIFSAQKANIPIDVCKIWGEDAVFLQQAAHITEGIYMRPDDPRGLLQILMFSFLPDMFSRNYLYLPGQDQVDFRAACFCHKKIVDIGFLFPCVFDMQDEVCIPTTTSNSKKIGRKGCSIQSKLFEANAWHTEKCAHWAFWWRISQAARAVTCASRLAFWASLSPSRYIAPHQNLSRIPIGKKIEGLGLHMNDIPRNQKEKIIFCIDLDHSMDEHFTGGDRINDTRINRTKQILRWFIEQKSRWNKQHEFAFMVLGARAVWHMDFTTDAELLSHVIDELYTMGRFEAFGNAMDMLYGSGRFYFDCIYIHNKAAEVSGSVKPQHVYDRLTEMEDVRAPGYFYETTRFLRKYTSAMSELLMNPTLRPPQDEVNFNLATPPSVQRQLEEAAAQQREQEKQQQQQQQQQQQEQQSQQPQQVFSLTPKRTDIPVTFKSPDMSSSSASSPVIGLFGPSPITQKTSAFASRTPPPPPLSSSTSPFASPKREQTAPSGVRNELQPSGSGFGEGTGGSRASSAAGSGTGTGAGTGMDDAILI
ncbi:RNA polymerase II transcription factor B subunit 4 [Mortierella sp. GBA30]|nr:RNA polymerase II transcription factor B subunit 4 [Mortierella sp. GBA30]